MNIKMNIKNIKKHFNILNNLEDSIRVSDNPLCGRFAQGSRIS